ncbi:transposase [Kineothrix alysoides]|uniref:transposase n=1 Tax=Kineothrix alysoides TaxID=1469948 RepID=UPI0009DE821B|nr:transposase [Kineothrix alysoides]
MSKRRKYSAEEKLTIVKRYLSGEASLREIGSELGYSNKQGYPGCFSRWIFGKYQTMRPAFPLISTSSVSCAGFCLIIIVFSCYA